VWLCNFHAKGATWRCRARPASLGMLPHVTTLLVDAPDLLLRSVVVASF
jgi:hypothetical protein